MSNITISCHYVAALANSLQRQGIDSPPHLLAVGIRPELLTSSRTRIPHQQFVDFATRVWRLLDDEHMGCAEHPLPMGIFRYVGKLMITSGNLQHALEQSMGLYSYVTQAYEMRLVETEDQVRFEAKLKHPERDPDHLLAEFILIGWHRTACWLIGKNIVLQNVSFDFPPPAHEVEYRFMFPCPRQFNQDTLSFSFSRMYLKQPVVQTEQSLHDYLSQSVSILTLKPVEDRSYATRIRVLLEQHRPSDMPSFEELAKTLYMTGKTLRQKLKAEGTSYQTIKDLLRRDTAIHYLTRSEMPISQITFKVGFTETGAFIRAFKNWTGLTPGAYRSQGF